MRLGKSRENIGNGKIYLHTLIVKCTLSEQYVPDSLTRARWFVPTEASVRSIDRDLIVRFNPLILNSL